MIVDVFQSLEGLLRRQELLIYTEQIGNVSFRSANRCPNNLELDISNTPLLGWQERSLRALRMNEPELRMVRR